jgi:4-alpha-glucanotransferase
VLDLNPDKKLAGVLAPVFALRGKGDLGIGDTEAVKELISWSARQGMRVVQILPINETGSDCSPYNLLSAMALEPSTITVTPEALPDLRAEDFAAITAKYDLEALTGGSVKYRAVKELKRELLYAAFKNFRSRGGDRDRLRAFADFEQENADWLPDYATHRALVSWHEESEVSGSWPAEHRSPMAARVWLEDLAPASKRQVRDLIRFHAYAQWVAYAQWRGVRDHAERENVALVGDVPVGVSIYSTDVWRDPEIFDLARSSGAPPEKVFKSDPFTEKWGQNWGFPLYHWEIMARDNYAWWRRRLRLLMSIFHLLRVDHALGFFRIYSFPWRPEDNEKFTDLTPEEAQAITGGELPHFADRDDETEENREYNRVHGETLFKMLVEGIGAHRLIAEDLGEVAPYVRPTLEALEIPGFKIPQWERQWDRLIPGTEYQRLSLATYATHDHAPVKSYWNDLDAAAHTENAQVREAAIHSMWELVNFCGQPDFKLPQPFSPELHQLLLRGLFSSNSWLAVNMITDIFGSEERFNVPGSAGDTNWTQRMAPIADWDASKASSLAFLKQIISETNRT